MKKTITIAALFALSFATGFTCSKNAPEQTKQEAPAQPADAAQAQMATPPAEGQPAQPADAAQAPAATDAAAQPATPPATETK